jgi:PPK2 family polyphosphate:nucleotide phosphotransferase
MSKYDLKSISTKPPKDADKDVLKEKTEKYISEIEELQDILYAERKRSILIIFQGVDGSGKDGAIKNVFSGVNPEGISVKSFKQPTTEELEHDFLWRIHQHTPSKGMMQIFNRSHYEDVVETRILGLIDNETANKRFKQINRFEKLLQDNGTVILKFYLHISGEEQLERLKERQTNKKKYWKYNAEDFDKAKHLPKYRQYYEEVFENCSPDIPWIIVPTDKNWYKEFIVAKETAKAMKELDLKYPPLK